MTRKRPLTPEEEALWEAVKGEAAPLPHKKKIAANKEVTGGRYQVSDKGHLPVSCYLTPVTAPLAQGTYAGIDRNTAERFRKGEYEIDGTLDLHGMTTQKAFVALHRFMMTHYSRGSRCVIIITGKGTFAKGGSEDFWRDESERGVLRKSLPLWLAHDDIAPMILTFDVAKQKHGGSGAFYVMLKRRR